MIKKKKIAATLGFTLAVASSSTYAALTSGTLLTIDPGQTACVSPASSSSSCITSVTSGSYFGFDLNADGRVTRGEQIAMSPGYDGGLLIGQIQPDPGSIRIPEVEGAGIDQPWVFFGMTGWHETTSPVTDLTGSGTVRQLDFSGWGININGVFWDMGNGGTATISCSSSACADGDSYTLDYSATVPVGEPIGFGGVFYQLHLEGRISAVPVPAAIWLFGSGLIGLAGVVRARKKQEN